VLRSTLLLPRGQHENATIYQPDQVLRHGTIDGARALGIGNQTGSLSPGKRADVIVLRANDLNLAPINVADGQVVLAAQPRNVEHVWIDGVQRKRDGELVDLDVNALVRNAQAAVAGLSERLGKPLT
jgi:5-methylthioadenosine/S-adenosylhomocysteine deaminase